MRLGRLKRAKRGIFWSYGKKYPILAGWGFTYQSAIMHDDFYLLDGKKHFVLDSDMAYSFIVVALSEESGDAEDGTSLFLVDAKSDGLTMDPVETHSLGKQ